MGHRFLSIQLSPRFFVSLSPRTALIDQLHYLQSVGFATNKALPSQATTTIVMNILSRVFHGKVAKISRDQHPATNQVFAKRSATAFHPSTRSPRRCRPKVSRPIPGLFGRRSTSRGRPSRRGPHLDDEFHIKQEEEGISPAMALQDHHDNVDGTWDENQDGLDEDKQRYETDEGDHQKDELKAEVGSEDEVNEQDDDMDEWDEEDAAEDSQALTVDETESPNHSLNSDELIPSIEDDEELYRPMGFSPYLHGKNKKTAHASSIDPEDEAEDEPVDEDFEAELEGEGEDGLLIHEDDLRDYLRHKRATPGVDKWPSEACRLYKLLYLRGLYPVMPSDWEWPLNRVHPMPAQLFMPMDSDDKALIRAEKSAFHGMCRDPSFAPVHPLIGSS